MVDPQEYGSRDAKSSVRTDDRSLLPPNVPGISLLRICVRNFTASPGT